MKMARKIGIILILVGLCLPTAALPFITEFHPIPNVCLTANFFDNMGNMEIVLRQGGAILSDKSVGTQHGTKIAIPYRYVFASGVIILFVGIGVVVFSKNKG